MAQNMVEHHASVVVNAPVHQVYSLFSHFNDFPKFMSFVKEVTYYDDQRSHWVAEVAGQHEWDAVNEDWIPDRQICWRSVKGLNNRGSVTFQPASLNQTHIDVNISYDPPAGVLGDIGEHLGAGRRFDEVLQNDLNNFAKMVELAPTNAEDPNWSQHLFHPGSAAAQGKTTERQNATMGGEFTTPETTQHAQSGRESYHKAETQASTPDYTSSPGLRNQQSGAVGTPATYSDYTSSPGLSSQSQENFVAPATTSSSPTVPGMGQSSSGKREEALADRPILDRDIINEPATAAPLDEREASARNRQEYPGQQTPEYNRENEANLPPEQIPPYYSEGDQPQRY